MLSSKTQLPILKWSIRLLDLPLKYTWKIARNSSEFKTNCIVEVTDGQQTGRGEVAPNVRYGESPELCLQQFKTYSAILPETMSGNLIHQSWDGEEELANALRFGVRSAYLDLASRSLGKTVSDLLGVAEIKSAPTCFSLPIMEVKQLEAFIVTHQLHRFNTLKVKVNRESAIDAVKEVFRVTGKPVILDGNEAWTDPYELLGVLHSLADLPILMVEQPMQATLVEQYKYLKPLSPIPLLADESLTDAADSASLAEQFHGVNVKLMKAGNPVVGVQQLKAAKAHGLKTMVGCMIETTLGLSMALHLASLADYLDLDGFLHLEKDPFELLTETNGMLSFSNEHIR